jgi:16S rRNA (cytidine1402-2'-O)-methyltransferase
LLAGLGIKSKLVSFHQHNQLARLPQFLEALEAGEALAVISDAGLPGISDPGEVLVAAARAAGRTVICIPGPCAVTTALVSSGLPSGRFRFEGFLPPKGQQRRARLRQLASEERTLVLFAGTAPAGGPAGRPAQRTGGSAPPGGARTDQTP